MSSPAARIGLAVTTIGRPSINALLDSAEKSTLRPNAVAISDQSSAGVPLDDSERAVPVVVHRSSGGCTRGRNEAAETLATDVDVLAFPNDDSWYPPELLAEVARRFAADPSVAALACASTDGDGDGLPPAGTELDRRTVWRAIEWRTFFRRTAYDAVGGFDERFGTGGPTPWQSGEGTDLLLRLMDDGGRVVSAADLSVRGAGERRGLTDQELVRKHRRYARGTGHVYRLHGYPVADRVRIVVAPWLRLHTFGVGPVVAIRIAAARSFGRVEGLLGRPMERRRRTPRQ